jgi:hypothetical protein
MQQIHLGQAEGKKALIQEKALKKTQRAKAWRRHSHGHQRGMADR